MRMFIRDVLIFSGINVAILGYLFAIYDVSADYFAAVNENFDRMALKEHRQRCNRICDAVGTHDLSSLRPVQSVLWRAIVRW